MAELMFADSRRTELSAATWTTELRDPFQTPAGVRFRFLQLPRQDVVLMKGFLNKDVFEACHMCGAGMLTVSSHVLIAGILTSSCRTNRTSPDVSGWRSTAPSFPVPSSRYWNSDNMTTQHDDRAVHKTTTLNTTAFHYTTVTFG